MEMSAPYGKRYRYWRGFALYWLFRFGTGIGTIVVLSIIGFVIYVLIHEERWVEDRMGLVRCLPGETLKKNGNLVFCRVANPTDAPYWLPLNDKVVRMPRGKPMVIGGQRYVCGESVEKDVPISQQAGIIDNRPESKKRNRKSEAAPAPVPPVRLAAPIQIESGMGIPSGGLEYVCPRR